MITSGQLLTIMPHVGANANLFMDPLNAAMDEFGIDNSKRQAAFIAQVAHESSQLSRITENLNYSYDGLLSIFPKYFDEITAEDYARQPERIANRVYANRNGNGDETSGDGWRFKGRGLIQLTGRNNYRACSEALFADVGFLLRQPEALEQPLAACRSAAWYWMANGLNELADDDDMFTAITKKINGGYIGLEERKAFWQRAIGVMSDG